MRGGRGGARAALERGRQLCLLARHGGQPLLQALRRLPNAGTTSVTYGLLISRHGLPVHRNVHALCPSSQPPLVGSTLTNTVRAGH